MSLKVLLFIRMWLWLMNTFKELDNNMFYLFYGEISINSQLTLMKERLNPEGKWAKEQKKKKKQDTRLLPL